MEKDNLKNWIGSRRDQFDDKVPSEKVWRNISRDLNLKENRFSVENILWKAAAIIFFGLSCYLLGGQNLNPATQTANEEFKSVESFYMKEIEKKKDLIYKMSGTEAIPDPASDLDLQRLDAMYEVLKEEYKKNPTKSVREALMLNLLIRTDILNDEITKIEEGNSQI